MNRPVIALAFAAASGAFAGQAHAGAWPQAEGQGQVIVTGIYSHSGKGFDAKGKTVDIDDYTKEEVYFLAEYGLTEDLTLLVTPSFSHVDVDRADAETNGLGYTELGARYRLAHGASTVFSLQGSVRIPGKKRRDSIAQVGATDSEIDLRALVGKSFKIGGSDAFVDLQGGYRIRNGQPPSEFRLDATLGIRPAPKLLLLAQAFNTKSDGAGRGIFGKYRYTNAYVSGVYDIAPRWSLQVGALATVSGRNALRERGVLAGVWFRF